MSSEIGMPEGTGFDKLDYVVLSTEVLADELLSAEAQSDPEKTVSVVWSLEETEDALVPVPNIFVGDVRAEQYFLENGPKTYPNSGSTVSQTDLESAAEVFHDHLSMKLHDNDASIQLTAELETVINDADSEYMRHAAWQFEDNVAKLSLKDIRIADLAHALWVEDLRVLDRAQENTELYGEVYSANEAVLAQHFENSPNTYWAIIGEESGEVKASGPRGWLYSSKKIDRLELSFGEPLHVYVNPNKPAEITQ